MFEQPVGHLFEREPHILVADFLGHDVERHGRKASMQRPALPADNTVPSPTPASKIRSAGGDGCKLPSSSEIRLATSVFSLQVETNSRYFCRLSKNRKPAGWMSVARRQPAVDRLRRQRDGLFCGASANGLRVFGQKGADLVQRAGGDPGAIAQARDQLAVIDDEPPEGGFGRLRRAAIFADFAENLVGGSGSSP